MRGISVPFDQAIAAGEVTRIGIGELVTSQTLSKQIEYFGPRHVGEWAYLEPPGGAQAQEIRDNLAKSDYQEFTVEALNRGGADHRLLADQGKLSQFIEVNCTISVESQVVRGEYFADSPPCEGIVRHRLKRDQIDLR